MAIIPAALYYLSIVLTVESRLAPPRPARRTVDCAARSAR
jgi:hypothetical protein